MVGVGILVHIVAGNLVSPLIMSKKVDLPPVLSIMAVLIAGSLLGPLGLVVAVPLLAAIMVRGATDPDRADLRGPRVPARLPRPGLGASGARAGQRGVAAGPEFRCRYGGTGGAGGAGLGQRGRRMRRPYRDRADGLRAVIFGANAKRRATHGVAPTRRSSHYLRAVFWAVDSRNPELQTPSLVFLSPMALELRLYNTMTRTVEPFAPADGQTVRMYTCGPTVYKPAHIGNFRTFLFEDLLRRTLRLRGWRVEQVMNLTDVDDKIIKEAAAQGTTIDAVTAPVITRFHEDRRYLKIEDAEHYPRATEYIPQMIDLVARLVAQGYCLSGRRSLRLFRDRAFPQLWAALAPRHSRNQGRRAGGAGRLLQGERTGLRPLEGSEARR